LEDNITVGTKTTADPPIKARHSLTARTLLSMGLRITLVVLAVSFLSYQHIVQTLEEQTYDKLQKYIQERGEKESSVFKLAQDNHQVFKQQFLYVNQHAPDVANEEFYSLYETKEDGSTRLRQSLYDGEIDEKGMVSRNNSAFVGANAPLDDQDFRNRLVHAYRLLNRSGAVLTTRFANVHASFPENGVIVHWPGLNWGANARFDTDVTTQEWYYVANKTNNPKRETVWTGLYYDETADEWMVTCVTPIDLDEKPLTYIGQDYMLNDLFERVFNDHLDGTYNFIFRQDGRLIAHPDKLVELRQAKGVLKIQDMGDKMLSGQYQLVSDSVKALKTGSSAVIFDKANDSFLAVSKISGPDWLFVTVFPKSLLSSAARTTAEFIFLLSVVSLIVELFMLFLVLRHKVVEPLKMFAGASNAIREGNFDMVASGQLVLPADRKDEVGALARMLRSMAGTINRNIVELKYLDRLKDDFMANTSHELRTPLNGIVGIAESMIDGAAGKLTDKQRYNLSLIVNSGQRLTHLVNDILDFSKLKHQELTLQIKPVDIHALTELVILLSRPLVRDTQIRLLNQIDGNTPKVLADENRVQQILYNLIGNAIKFTKQGLISVTASVEKGYVYITVKDTGIGIAAGYLDKIFESFEQGDSSTAREFGGTGLGLAVTKQLVELHNGQIEVKSSEGKGSSFTFTLPICQDSIGQTEVKPTAIIQTDDSDTEVEEQARLQSSGQGDNSAGCILVVDDEPINIQVMQNHLELHNYSVTTAFSGKEAMAAIQNHEKFDAVLLDVMMPGMTGYEVCRQIRKRYPANQLPILMVTAKSNVDDMTVGFESGANDYLTKPISKVELLERLKTHISMVSLNDDLAQANVLLQAQAQTLELRVEQRTSQLEESDHELGVREKQLDVRSIELQKATQQLSVAKQKVSKSEIEVSMLEDFGRGLTATLELNQVIKSIYRGSNQVMDVCAFLLGILDEENNLIHVPLIVEEGQKLPAVDYELSDVNSPASWCVRNKKELLIFEHEDIYRYFDYGLSAPKRGKSMNTVIYQPLVIGDKIVGCLSVQHPDEHAYSKEQVAKLRTLASYSAIAIANASGYAKLEETYKTLKDTQKQLVLQEKMASLGTLTAGVAHEINNPTNFVHVGAENLQVDLLRFQQFILDLAGDDADIEVLDSLEQHFNPLNEHIETIINGTERIKSIVEDLRTFTHLQSADKKPADLTDCVKSTIKLVKTKYLEITEFYIDYNPLPQLVCFPAQLNQVIMNIIINACDAIEEKQNAQEHKHAGKIFVTCKFKEGSIIVSIADNGCGMDEQIRLKLFEPFYTTKEVGGGTGLGMAISFGIVEDHGGSIVAKSAKGVGTVVTVQLPFL
jgi:signal transduction histidine kinase/DNA-binding response OmpR family regulator